MNRIFTFLTAMLFATVAFSQQNILDTFVVDGNARNYILHVPPGYNSANSYALVLNLHGLTSNANQQMNYSKMNEVADTDTEPFFVVYGNGMNNSWASYGTGTVDDNRFLSELIDTISAHYNIDPNAVFSCGMSNGGIMSYQLACVLSDKIAAVASVTGTMSQNSYANCVPNRKVPVMHIHGTSDPIVSYNGGGITGTLVGVEETVSFWRDTNDCTNISDTTNVPNSNTSDNTTAQLIRYQSCANSSEVYFYKIANGGHRWPGGDASIMPYGNINMDFSASREIWSFFKRHKKGQDILSVKKINNLSATLFPNPFENILSITLSDELPTTVSVFDMSGKQLFREENVKQNTTISTTNWAIGMYVVHLQNKNGTQINRVVKE